MVRLQLQRLLELDGSLVRLPLGELDVAEDDVQLGVLVVDFEGAQPHQLGQGVLLPVEVALEHDLVGGNALRVPNQRLARKLERAVMVAAVPVELGQGDPRTGVVGKLLGNVCPLSDGRGDVALLGGEAGQGLGRCLQGGLLVQCRTVERKGLFALALALGQHGEVVVRLGQARVGLPGGVVLSLQRRVVRCLGARLRGGGLVRIVKEHERVRARAAIGRACGHGRLGRGARLGAGRARGRAAGGGEKQEGGKRPL